MFHTTAALLVMVLAAGPGLAQSDVAKTFEHYEAIRVALADDVLKGVEGHAKALLPLAEAIGGPEARKAAAGIGKARDIKVAREHFGLLSASLLPKFEAASLEGVHLFTCGMVSQSWAQRGQKVQNPYMGKSMLACGSPYEGKK